MGGNTMKLRMVSIKGFRSIRQIELNINDFLCFIGENNCGKSNIFYALELFFSSGTRNVTPEIFFRSKSEIVKEVVIEAIFEDLSPIEMEKLGPWSSNGKLTVCKKYMIDVDGKPQISYEAILKIPKDEWLKEDFEHYSDRNVVSSLPIAQFLPSSGRITKQIYKDAVQKFLGAYPDKIEWVEERRENPAGFKQVLDGYLPEFHLVKAVCDVEEETKTSGTSLLSRILSVIISRIIKQNPTFKRLEMAMNDIKISIEGKTPEEKLAEIRELENKLKQELGPWNIELTIGVEAPDIEKIFQLGTHIILDDGIPTDVNEKGHGLQRSLIFAMMRVWAAEAKHARAEEASEIRERSHIFAFEEPEIFLHPQMCRATYESLKQISSTDQILVSTHSPHFIDIADYPIIVVVKKPGLEEGTKIQRVEKELFEGEKKKQFNMVRFFNPDKNELFFAKKAVLVEGPTEKAVLPLLARRIDVFKHAVSIIDCGSKFNLTLFMEVLNAFRIPYIVIHDEDPIDPDLQPGGTRYHPDRLAEAQRAFEENKKIKDACDASVGKVKSIPGEFENILGISRSQTEKLSKPFVAVQKYVDENVEIPSNLKDIVKEIYS